MYKQTLHVTYNAIDRSARETAETIAELVQGRDLNNLVVMCGEDHSQLTHRFFAVQMMHYLHETTKVGVFFEEFSARDLSFLKSLMSEKDIAHTCRMLTELKGASDQVWLPSLYAVRQGIDVCFMDLPVSKIEGMLPYVAALEQNMICDPRLQELMEYDINVSIACGGEEKSFISNSGAIRRDLFMADMIGTHMDGKKDGMGVTLNGRAHLADYLYISRPTLTDFLLQTGKDVICVSCNRSDEILRDDALGQNLSGAKSGQVLAFFQVNMPRWTPLGSQVTQMWADIAWANGVAP